jgi:hypothetical protein
MIRTPHPLHAHRRSTLYIYKVFQHLLQWLLVIMIQSQPNICSLGPESGCSWCRRWSLCGYLWLRPHTQLMLIGGLLYIYIKCFSTFYSGRQSYGCNINLIYAGFHTQSGSRRFSRALACSMMQVMIAAPHPLHTHSRSSSYIYKVFQLLLLRLAVIWMRPQPDIICFG